MGERGILKHCIVLAVALALSMPAGQLQTLVDPASYRSADGRFELLVDPSHRYGSGPARYRMSVDGQEQWSVEHPFTLQQAVVSTSGGSAGYAYSLGLAGTGEFVIASLNADGTVRHEERFQPVAPPATQHRNPNPRALGLYLQESQDRFVVRVADIEFQSQHEPWWVFRLSTGELERKLDLHAGMEDPGFARWSIYAEPLPGSPLVLSLWDAYREGRGGRYCLSDEEGRIVWQHDRPLDHEIEGGIKTVDLGLTEVVHHTSEQSALDQRIRRGGSILALGPGPRFELWFVRDRARVSFRVSGDETSGWNVEEVERRPLELGEMLRPVAEATRPSLELGSLGSVSFARADRKPIRVSAVTLDSTGRIYLGEEWTAAVHVFDSVGGLLHTCRREGVPRTPQELTVRGDGNLFVWYGLGSWTEFSSDGSFAGDLTLRGQWLFRPGTARRCGAGWEEVLWLDEEDVEQCRVERASDGRWLHGPRLCGFSSEGVLILTSETYGGQRFLRLDLRGTAGEPRRVLTLPRIGDSTMISRTYAAWHGNTIAVALAGALLLYRDDGAMIGSWRTPERFADPRGLFFSPDGRELWLFSEQGLMLRLAAP